MLEWYLGHEEHGELMEGVLVWCSRRGEPGPRPSGGRRASGPAPGVVADREIG